jgi:hypothetical protein
MADLPKPFRAQKVTNGNANEAITNFLIRTGTTIPYVESNVINMIKNRKSFNGKHLVNNPIIYHDEENNKITFSNHRLYDYMSHGIYEHMIKCGYTFTCNDKQQHNAMKEIYIRTKNLNTISQ